LLLPLCMAAGARAILGDASAGAAEPQYLLGIAVDEAQTAYLADRELPGIWRLADGKLSLLFQGSKKFRTPLNAVRCVAIDGDGRLLAGDSATRDVYRMGEDGKPQPLTKGEIGIPSCIAVAKSGEILVGDLETHRIWKVPAAGGQPELFAQLPAPRGLHVDREDRVWIVSHGKDQLLRMTASGKPEVIVAGRPFEFPSAVVVDGEGTAYVCDTYAKAIWKVASGKPPAKWLTGDPLVSPVGLAWQGENLLVADPRAKGVVRIDPAGKASRVEFTVQAE
jgi:streptogramin lyase